MKLAWFVGVAFLVLAADASATTLRGRIRAASDVARPAPLSVAVDGWACAAGGTIADPGLVIDADRGLADVVIELSGVAGAPPYQSAAPVLLDQKSCAFAPHVVVVAPGEDLRVRNSDSVLHNFRTLAKANRTVNKAQVKGKEETFRFATPEIIPVECDVHYWMSAVVVVARDAWTAVTGADGTFRIDGIPSGDYTVSLWHQKLGVRTETVHVGDADAVFELEWPAPATPPAAAH